MSFTQQQRLWLTLTCLIVMLPLMAVCQADDWPMWRHNSGRTATTTDSLPVKPTLRWERQLPTITPAFHSSRLQFDAGYEPVVADGRLLIASSRHDSVTAYEAKTGRELWVYHTNGPVRFAPAVVNDSVCFGSDDGHLYCVELSTGKLRWKHRAVPSDRRLLGNRRLISVWPVRGGPVVADGRVYFAAGVWPFEGVFVGCLEIATGDLVWRNERLGYLFGQQPHNTQAIGGLAPQGYLVINEDELIVPCSTAYPARLNRETGELLEFALPSPGRLPGGWFAAMDAETSRAIRRGKLTFDDVVNSQLHEDKMNKGHGDPGISRIVRAGDRELKFDEAIQQVDGAVHSMVVADGQLFVTTRTGKIYCFCEANDSQPKKSKKWEEAHVPLAATSHSRKHAQQLIQQASGRHGVAFVVGLEDGSVVKALLQESDYHVVAFDDDEDLVRQLRQELQLAGHYGTRAAVMECNPAGVSLPPYLATLIVTESPEQVAKSQTELLQSLRPYGGIAVLEFDSIIELNDALTPSSPAPGKFEYTDADGLRLVRRVGALPGAADYQGNYQHCEDTLVRFPLGVLWFDDTLAHFKRSPQPKFVDGVMVSRPKDWHAPRVNGNYSVDYPLLKPVLSDMYTGRVLEEVEEPELRSKLPDIGRDAAQQSYYHAPHQKTALNPKPPIAGERINPLTGIKEPRVFPKTYGCDGGVDYGLFYTLRSGTAAFYDKTLESGTVFLSGPRSGCTNSIIPSGGLLNVPYFYEGCTCSYPLPTGLSLVAMPESHEQWSSWGDDSIAKGSIQRIGINFGAPGDRKTRNGTLWLDYPSVGGPSPKVRVETKPKAPTYHYRHSLWMSPGEGWSWVAASSVEGLREFTLHDLKPGSYTVRLHFAEPTDIGKGDRVQTVSLQGQPVLSEFDILAETQQKMTGVVRQFHNVAITDTLTMTLQATVGQSLISGIELVKVD